MAAGPTKLRNVGHVRSCGKRPCPRTVLRSTLVALVALAACGLAEVADLTLVGSGATTKPNGSTQGDDPTTSTGPDVATPGTLTVRGSLGANAVQKRAVPTPSGALRRDAASLRVACSTHAVPPSTASAPLDAQGGFKVQLAHAVNVPLACSLVDANNVLLANFTFQGGGQDIDGNARVAHEVALTGDANFGRVYYDDSTFEVAVNNDNVDAQRVDVTPGSVTDPTGAWTLAAVDFAPPPGSSNVCDAGTGLDTCPANLHVGDALAWLQFAGKRVNGNGSVWALQVWDAPAQATACGNKLGLSDAAQKQAGLNFGSAAGGPLNYSTSLSWPNAANGGQTTSSSVANGYALVTAAQAGANYGTCVPLAVHAGNANVQGSLCGPDFNRVFRFVGSDGCVNEDSGLASASLPYFGDYADARAAGRCATSRPTGNVVVERCHVTTNGEPLVCSTTTVDYANAQATATLSPNSFDDASFNEAGLAALGDACTNVGSATAAARLAQRRCFVDFAHTSGAVDSDDACLADVQVNAAAADATLQLVQDYRPRHLRTADLLQPLDATSGTVATRRTATRTAYAATPRLGPVPLGCLVVRTRSVTFTRVSATRLLATFTEQAGTDDTRPACLAAFAAGATRTVAYLDRS